MAWPLIPILLVGTFFRAQQLSKVSYWFDESFCLKMDEFRSTFVANRVDIWPVFQQDRDQDGLLSPAEFVWTPGLELALLKAEYFRRLDVDHNGFLDPKEFTFQTSPVGAAPEPVNASSTLSVEKQLEQLEQAFKRVDKEQDGQLNEAEFVGVLPETARPLAKRELLVFDRDGNSKLNLAEYRNILSRVTSALRGSMPSPFQKLLDERMTTIEKSWPKWDTDREGTLNKSEFEACELGRSIPGFALSTFADWDRDRDGSISQKDCRWLLEAGYGLRRMDGQLLYLPTGQTVYVWVFKSLDADHNDRLSRDEYLKQGPDAKAVAAQFEKEDLNQNNEISFKEWAEKPIHWVDAVPDFLFLDKNLDGQIAPEELNGGVYSGLKALANAVFPGFDLDRNGKLSLDEFRSSFLVNRVEVWPATQRDSDNDGRLSQSEFAWTPGLELALLKAEYFRRLDIDRSGFLEPDEFSFQTDPAKIYPKISFEKRDRDADGELTLDEVLADLKPNPAVAHDQNYETLVVRIEEEFLKADANGNKSLNREELATPQGKQVFSPDLSFKTGNTQSLKVQVPQAEESSRQWLVPVLGFNVLLVAGVIAYLFMKQ